MRGKDPVHSALPRFGLSAGAAVLYALLFYWDDSGLFAALLPALVCHEAGHWAVLRLCGARVHAVRLDLGGVSMETDALTERWQEALCALAGPAFGVLWAPCGFAMGSRYGRYSAALSLLLSAYNLLPVPPLDGWRVLSALTGTVRGRWAGVACGVGLLLAAWWLGLAPLGLPGAWLAAVNLRGDGPAASLWPGAPGATPAPGKRSALGCRHPGSCRGSSAGR